MAYSPTLGRWAKQDPAGYVDGPDLFIAYGTNPASMLDPEGLKIILEGTEKEKKTLTEMLEDLNKMDRRFRDMIAHLKISPNEHHLHLKSFLPGLATVNPRPDDPDCPDNKIGYSTDVYGRNAEGKVDPGGKYDTRALAVFAHELSHAWDFDKGEISAHKEPVNPRTGVFFTEERAVRAGNVVLNNAGMPIDLTYGGRKIENPDPAKYDPFGPLVPPRDQF